MKRLTATFRARLDEPILCVETTPNVFRPLLREEATFAFAYEGFDVELSFSEFAEYGKGMTGGEMAREVTEVTISVGRDDSDEPPENLGTDGESIDLTKKQLHFRKKYVDYSNVALATLGNLLSYFRYRLGTPLVRPSAHAFQPGMLNPSWTDETGRVLFDRSYTVAMTTSDALRLYPDCAVRAYSAAVRPELLAALQKRAEATLHEELVAEAKDAIAQGQLRRGVLELAIACESGVKQHYFGVGSSADAAFSYLEDKGRVSGKVLDFFDAIALRAFGRSLREDRPDCYRQIDWLFRCRNRVAHRGVLAFRDDGGNEIVADAKRLIVWWQSVDEAFAWLRSI